MMDARSRTAVSVLTALFALPIQVLRADEPISIGTISVQRHGDHGSPIVLIPGLASGGWVWEDVVTRLKGDHVLYVVTLAGFDGKPAVEGKLIDLAEESIVNLIRAQHIEKPVLVGHSLGGTLAIRFAQNHSDLISGVVAVDGLPVFPGLETLSAERRAQVAEQLRSQITNLTPPQFAAQQVQYMKTIGVVDAAMAEKVASQTARSDPAATAQYMAEDIVLDLRPELASIKVPLLEIVPHNAADVGPRNPLNEADKVAYYKRLLEGTPELQVVPIAGARHFAMLDQPEAFATTLANFLAKTQAATPSTRPAAK